LPDGHVCIIFGGVAWDVFFTEIAEAWLDDLGEDDFDRVMAAADLLSERGPDLGRPTVDSVASSRHANMKELRTGTLRALFAFDPERRAIILIGGDKRGDWTGWYERNIPLADDRYDQHLSEEGMT
jgi:hypothetical protein